jgi:hypothetical protein
MDYLHLLNEVKMRSDREVKTIASAYGVDLSTKEIQALRPLLDEISFHWILTGIPESFINKIRKAIGNEKTDMLFRMYIDATK